MDMMLQCPVFPCILEDGHEGNHRKGLVEWNDRGITPESAAQFDEEMEVVADNGKVLCPKHGVQLVTRVWTQRGSCPECEGKDVGLG